MGGKPYLNEEDKLARKRANSLKYYHKKKNDKAFIEKNREYHRTASRNYYKKNKPKCQATVLKWRQEHPKEYARIQQRAYQKRKYGRVVVFIKKPKPSETS